MTARNKRYTTLWIPVVYGKYLNPLNYIENPDDDFIKKSGGYRKYSLNEMENFDVNEEIEINTILISDKAEQEVLLNLTLCKSEENVEMLSIPKRSIKLEAISYDNSTREIFNERIFLKCITTNSNGLFQYEYEDNGQKLLLNKSRGIVHAVYHSIKSFYHEHKYHDPIADSIITPFISDRPISFNKLNNPALAHYLKEVEKMFEFDVEFLREVKNALDKEYSKLEKKSKESNITKDKQAVINAKRIQYRSIYHELLENHNKVIKKQTYYHALISQDGMLSESVENNDDNKSINKALCTVEQQKEEIINLLNRETENEPKLTEKGLGDIIGQFGELLTQINNNTRDIKTVSEKSDRFSVRSFWGAVLITLILGGADYYYYRQTASKEDANEIKIQLKIQQDTINHQKEVIEEMKKLIISSQ